MLITAVFLPEASFGLRVLSLPACVRVSVNHELISAITRHNFQLKSPNWDQKMQNILLKVPIVLGTDWAWPSRSNFTLLKNYVYLHRFCIFEIFVRHVCLTAPHPTWLRTHSLTTTCHRQGHAIDCETVYMYILVRPSEFQPTSTRRLALNFTNSCRFLAATKQLYEWYFLSVCPSVRLSVRLSHLFDYVPIIVSSWNFQELSHWTRVRSMQKVKVRGQRSRSQRSRPKFSFPDCNSSLNSHMMMKWYI